jgi:hypothetical protein
LYRQVTGLQRSLGRLDCQGCEKRTIHIEGRFFLLWIWDREGMMEQAIKLIDEIAQDSEVIRTFKFHSFWVMVLAELLAKKVGCYDARTYYLSLGH